MAKKLNKTINRKKELKNINSLRIGIASSVIAIINLLFDFMGLFIDIKFVSAVVSFVILVGLIWIFSKPCGIIIAKIKNKEYARNIIETATFSSIFGFVIERIMLPFANDIENIAITVFLSILFIMLPIIVFLILRLKKEWGYYVD